ncbi:MAG: hypothetical protein K2N94_03320, partial [Lachnospiraceae bacterium]|nr:hypothetical protein [Lachnospiraceae bacterium]
MLNRKGNQTEKWEELFTLLELSAEEKRAAEAYLAGERGKEAPAEIGFKDLSTVSGEAVRKLFYDLIQKKNRAGLENVKDDMGRLFNLLFARSRVTCHAMIPLEVLTTLQKTEWGNAPGMAAVYAAEIGGQGYVSSYMLNPVLEIAGHKPKNLKRAFELEGNQTLNGKFVLLALYFYEKYQKNAKDVPEPDDLPLLSRYEEIAVTFFGSLYFNSADPSLLDELSQGVAAGQIPERFAPLVGTNPQVSTSKLRLTAGLSYLNYTRSEKLKNIVRLCLLAGMTETLEALYTMS